MNKLLSQIDLQLTKATLSRAEWFLILSLIISLSLGQLLRLPLSSTVAIYPHDLLIMVWLVLHAQQLTIYFSGLINRETFKAYRLEIGFASWLLLGMIFATPSMVPWLYLSRLILYVLFLVSLRTVFSKQPTALRVLITAAGFLFIWYGLLQYLFFPDLRFLFTLGWDDHFYRLSSTMLDPNFAGIVFVLTFLYTYSLEKLISRKLWLALLGASIFTLTLTYSRSSYLALIVSLGLLTLKPFPTFGKRPITKQFMQKSKYAFFALLLMLGTYILAPKPGGEGVDLTRTASIQARTEVAASAISHQTPTSFLIGKGFYSWNLIHHLPPSEFTTHARVPDNLFVMVFASTGLVGLTLFLFILIKQLRFVATRDWLVLTAVVAVLVHSQFNNTLLEPFVLLFLGIGIVSAKYLKPATRP